MSEQKISADKKTNKKTDAEPNDGAEIIRHGRIRLATPIYNADGDTVETLVYDFDRITGSMLMTALGTDSADNASKLTARQALELFMRAVDPANNSGVTMMDMRTKLSAEDTALAVRLGNSFFTHSWIQALTRIEKL